MDLAPRGGVERICVPLKRPRRRKSDRSDWLRMWHRPLAGQGVAAGAAQDGAGGGRGRGGLCVATVCATVLLAGMGCVPTASAALIRWPDASAHHVQVAVHSPTTIVGSDGRASALLLNKRQQTSASSARGVAGDGTRSTVISANTAVTSRILPASSSVPDDPRTGTSAITSLPVSATTTTVTRTASATASISTSTAVPANYALPQAFDTTLGTNFTGTACPSFFATFLADPTFQQCAPFSLLLGTSTAFFTAQRNPFSLLTYVLDASCAASLDACSDLMSQLAARIRLPNTCGADLQRRNPLVMQALQGFQNYQLMRQAGCQKSNTTDHYCFVDACAASEPDQLYFYYLPEGTTLPSGTSSQCESCTQGLMNLYSQYATNSTLAISNTYAAARSLTVLDCGPTYAPAVVAASSSSSASGRLRLFDFSSLLAVFGGCFVVVWSTRLMV